MVIPVESKWAIDARWLPQLQGLLRQAIANPQAARKQSAAMPKAPARGAGAVLGLYGLLSQRGEFFGTPLDDFQEDFNRAINSAGIELVLIDIDSPGGTTYGVEETADVVRAGARKKPVIATANSLAASAAFWIGSAATKLFASPGADVGSVGVYALHVDLSRQLEEDGVTISIVNAGKYKAEGNSFEPLNKEARDYMQLQVDASYTAFVNAVAVNRGTSPNMVRASYGEGRILNASQALRVGAIDGIRTFQDVSRDAVAGKFGGMTRMASAASMDVLRLRQQHRQRKEAHDLYRD